MDESLLFGFKLCNREQKGEEEEKERDLSSLERIYQQVVSGSGKRKSIIKWFLQYLSPCSGRVGLVGSGQRRRHLHRHQWRRHLRSSSRREDVEHGP